MKKILLASLCLLAAGAAAQADDFIKFHGEFDGLYPDFCMGNQYVYLENEDEGIYTIYDDQFNVVKTITINAEDYQYNAKYDYGNGDVYEDQGERTFGACELSIDDPVYDINSYGVFTQNLFNDDASFEYVRLCVEPRSFTRNYDWCTETYTNYPVATGFEVVSESGEVLSSVRFPEGIDGESHNVESPDFLVIGGKVYLKFYVGNEGETFLLLYPVNKGNTFNAPIMIKAGAKVSPNNVRRSDMVNVTLDQPATHTCGVKVVSTNGSVVYSASINAGEESAQINTSRFAPGVYIVNICDGQTITENSKLIVR